MTKSTSLLVHVVCKLRQSILTKSIRRQINHVLRLLSEHQHSNKTEAYQLLMHNE